MFLTDNNGVLPSKSEIGLEKLGRKECKDHIEDRLILLSDGPLIGGIATNPLHFGHRICGPWKVFPQSLQVG